MDHAMIKKLSKRLDAKEHQPITKKFEKVKYIPGRTKPPTTSTTTTMPQREMKMNNTPTEPTAEEKKKKKKAPQPSENPKGGLLGGIYSLLPESMKGYTGGGSMRKGGGVKEEY